MNTFGDKIILHFPTCPKSFDAVENMLKMFTFLTSLQLFEFEYIEQAN